jgi:CDP-paratose synthetase
MRLKEKNPGLKKILISGGTGFLGGFVVRHFLAKGYVVTVLKRPTSNLKRIDDVLDQVTLININEFDSGEFDLFVHTASSYGRNNESEKEISETNIDLPLSLISKLNVKNLHLINIDTSLPSFVNTYAKTKHEFVEEVRSQYPSLRFSNLVTEQFYGPHDGTFISFIINSLKKKVLKLPLTKGEQNRDLIYFEDVINAIDVIAEKSKGGDFPVGSGRAYSIREVVEVIADRVLNTTTKLEFGKINYRHNEVMNSLADTSKLKALGWEPLFDFNQGLVKTLDKW